MFGEAPNGALPEEVEALERVLRADARVSPSFHLRDVQSSGERTGRSSTATLCGLIAPPIENHGDARYQPVSVTLNRIGARTYSARNRAVFGAEARAKCQSAHLDVVEVEDLAPMSAASLTQGQATSGLDAMTAQRGALERVRGVREPSPAEMKALMDALHDSDLRDPRSVQTRRVMLGDQGGVVHACGQFNAKNAYGAYVGFKPFLAIIASGKATIVSLGSSDTDAYAAASVCAQRGLPVD